MDAKTHAQVLALERMGTAALRQRFAEIFGEQTKVGNRAWLIKRIAWRLQAVAEGDLSERARRRAAELADDADLRLNPRRQHCDEGPKPAAPASRPTAPAPAAESDWLTDDEWAEQFAWWAEQGVA
jgi:hypothetical protein